MRTVFTVGIATACALACAACGGPHSMYPVSGKVLHNGEPAVGATVTFVRKDATDRLTEQTPKGVVQSDGSFELASPGGKGAAPGEYVVLVEWKQGAGQVRGRSPGLNAPDRLKRRYLNPNRPLLTATILSEFNTANIPPNGPHAGSNTAYAQVVKTYLCPSDPTKQTLDYYNACWGPYGNGGGAAGPVEASPSTASPMRPPPAPTFRCGSEWPRPSAQATCLLPAARAPRRTSVRSSMPGSTPCSASIAPRDKPRAESPSAA